MSPLRIKKGDTVKVVTGKDKGKSGSVTRVKHDKNTAVVEGLRMVKRHTKPNQKSTEGGIIEKEAPINMTNLMLVCGRCKKPTRFATKAIEEKKGLVKRVRVCKHCGEII